MSRYYQTCKEITMMIVLAIYVCALFLDKGKVISVDPTAITDLKDWVLTMGLNCVMVILNVNAMILLLCLGFNLMEKYSKR